MLVGPPRVPTSVAELAAAGLVRGSRVGGRDVLGCFVGKCVGAGIGSCVGHGRQLRPARGSATASARGSATASARGSAAALARGSAAASARSATRRRGDRQLRRRGDGSASARDRQLRGAGIGNCVGGGAQTSHITRCCRYAIRAYAEKSIWNQSNRRLASACV